LVSGKVEADPGCGEGVAKALGISMKEAKAT
jgi:hypothetical protein